MRLTFSAILLALLISVVHSSPTVIDDVAGRDIGEAKRTPGYPDWKRTPGEGSDGPDWKRTPGYPDWRRTPGGPDWRRTPGEGSDGPDWKRGDYDTEA